MLWLMTPADASESADVGRLNYSEAMLFARAGDDIRRASWEAGVFVRETDSRPSIVGYRTEPYRPTWRDYLSSDWRRA